MGYCVVDSFYRLYQKICFCISNANLKQILTDVDSVIIADIAIFDVLEMAFANLIFY
jgi:hypothetical protein